MLYRDQLSEKENDQVEKVTRKNAKEIGSDLLLGVASDKELRKRLYWYVGWALPSDAYLIGCYFRENGTVTYEGVHKTFHSKRAYRVSIDGKKCEVTFALLQRYNGFPYKITKNDRAVIKQTVPALWEIAKGDADGKILPLVRAAPILLGAPAISA